MKQNNDTSGDMSLATPSFRPLLPLYVPRQGISKLTLGEAHIDSDNVEPAEKSRSLNVAWDRETKLTVAHCNMRESADATLQLLDTHQPEPRPTIASPQILRHKDINVLWVRNCLVGTSTGKFHKQWMTLTRQQIDIKETWCQPTRH